MRRELISTHNGVKNYAGSRGGAACQLFDKRLLRHLFLFHLGVSGCSRIKADACPRGTFVEVVHRMLPAADLVFDILRVRVCGPI